MGNYGCLTNGIRVYSSGKFWLYMFAERETSGERPPPGFCSHNVLPLESLPLAEHFLNQTAMYSFMCTQLLQSFHAPLVRPQGHPSRPTLEFSALWS